MRGASEVRASKEHPVTRSIGWSGKAHPQERRRKTMNYSRHSSVSKLSLVDLGSKVTEPLTLSFHIYEMVVSYRCYQIIYKKCLVWYLACKRH